MKLIALKQTVKNCSGNSENKLKDKTKLQTGDLLYNVISVEENFKFLATSIKIGHQKLAVICQPELLVFGTKIIQVWQTQSGKIYPYTEIRQQFRKQYARKIIFRNKQKFLAHIFMIARIVQFISDTAENNQQFKLVIPMPCVFTSYSFIRLQHYITKAFLSSY